MFTGYKFYLTLENFSETVQQIETALTNEKLSKKELLNANLLLEETFMRLINIGKAEGAKVIIAKRFGDLTLRLESEGNEYNPLIYATDFDDDDEEDEDYFRTIILKSNAEKMNYVRKGNKNVVIIQIHENANKQLDYTLFGMIAGIAVGLLFRVFAPPETAEFFSETISGSINTMFMNALNMMISPVIFFSIIAGITGITNTADLGRIGGKLIGLYSLTTIISTVLCLSLAGILFSGDVPQIGVVEGNAETTKLSIWSTIINIIPENLINPIVNRELLQIIFMAVLFGFCINKLGDRVRLLNNFVQSLNTLCLNVLMIITMFIPLVTFFAMISTIINLGLDSMVLLGKVLLGLFIFYIAIICVYGLIIKILGKVSPIPMIKKLPEIIPIPLSTSSSNASMPFTMKFCTEKLGIEPKISSFSIPIGATINMDGVAAFYAITCIMILRVYGVEIDSTVIFTLLLAIFTVSIGTPGVPGSGTILMAAVVGVFGIPADAVLIVMGIIPIVDRTSTVSNVIGDIAVTTALAANENLLDKSVYYKM